MLRLIQMITPLVSAVGAVQRARQSVVSAAIIMVGIVLALTGAGFLIAALWLHLADLQGAVAANLWIGSGILLVTAVAIPMLLKLQKRPAAPALPDMTQLARSAARQLGAGAGDPARTAQTLAIAAAAGFLLARMLMRR
jgi:formate-dependent nitrite reductase membrane component NrfD